VSVPEKCTRCGKAFILNEARRSFKQPHGWLVYHPWCHEMLELGNSLRHVRLENQHADPTILLILDIIADKLCGG
jgi:hypothetical protein